MAMARDFPTLMPNAKCRLRGPSRRRPGCWSAGDRLVLLVRGGNRRGCQYHDILLFGCYFFLQSERTPNRRLRERAVAGMLRMAAWEALDNALSGDCGCGRTCSGRCGPERCSQVRQLKVDGNDFRSFGEVTEILQWRWLRGSCSGGARGARGDRGCGVGCDCCASNDCRRGDHSSFHHRRTARHRPTAARGERKLMPPARLMLRMLRVPLSPDPQIFDSKWRGWGRNKRYRLLGSCFGCCGSPGPAIWGGLGRNK